MKQQMHILAAAVFIGVLSLHRVAVAQVVVEDNLESIHHEGHQSTALYAWGTCLLGTGLLSVGAGGLAALAAGLGGGDSFLYELLFAAGGILGGVGLILFIPAIILDVDSGMRLRRYQEATGAQAEIRIGPGSVGFSTRF